MPPAALHVVDVTASANDGNKPDRTLDGDLDTRWSAEGEQWIQWDLGEVRSVQRVAIAFFKGDERRARFDVEVSTSSDGHGQRVLQDVESGGSTTDLETFDFTPVPGRYVRYVGHGNDHSDWNSLTEAQVWGTETAEDPGHINGGQKVTAQVVVYPKIDSLKTSTVFRVSAADQPIWTEEFSDPAKKRTIHVANFAVADGSVPVRVQVLTHSFGTPEINTTQPPVSATKNADSFDLTLDGPRQLVVFVPTNDGEKVLYLSADPLEDDGPHTATHHFAAGVHDGAEGKIELKDGESVYIAAGALVKGYIRAVAPNHHPFTGITVTGRGILQGQHAPDGDAIYMQNCQNVTVEGITVRRFDQDWSTKYDDCDHVMVRDVKVFSFGVNGDGIDPRGCTDFTIDRCLISTGDDCIAVKSSGRDVVGITVSNCVLETYKDPDGHAGGDGMKIGTETDCDEIRTVRVHDCEIVGSFGSNSWKGSSAFSIVNRIRAKISDVEYTNIHVENRIEHNNFEIRMVEGCDGSVSGVRLTNVVWEGNGAVRVFRNDVDAVTFDSCVLAGHPLRKDQLLSDDDGHHGPLPGVTVVP